jgi:hypothetical protein
VCDIDGRYERVDAPVETYLPAIIPDLSLPLRAMFAELDLIDDMPERPSWIIAGFPAGHADWG